MKVKIRYNCSTCKFYDPDECYCTYTGEHEVYPEDSCDGWADKDWPDEPTEEEKREIVGDRKAHQIMVEGDIV